MKLLVVFLCSAIVAINASSFLELTRGRKLSTRTTIECTTDDSGFKCNSCTTGLICVGAESVGQSSCPTENSYCDSATNTCVKNKPSTCTSATADDFKCNAEGFWPSLSSCEQYYFCSAAAATAELWECPNGYVYNAALERCNKKVYSADCVSFKCVNANEIIVHKGNPQVWAFCNDALVASVFKCPKNKEYSAGCKYVCKAAGYFAGTTEDEAYFCTKSGTTWTQNIYKCPSGYVYNSSFTCVKSTTTTTPEPTSTTPTV